MVTQLKPDVVNVIEIDVGGMKPPKIREYLREQRKTIQNQLESVDAISIRFILIPKRSY